MKLFRIPAGTPYEWIGKGFNKKVMSKKEFIFRLEDLLWDSVSMMNEANKGGTMPFSAGLFANLMFHPKRSSPAMLFTLEYREEFKGREKQAIIVEERFVEVMA